MVDRSATDVPALSHLTHALGRRVVVADPGAAIAESRAYPSTTEAYCVDHFPSAGIPLALRNALQIALRVALIQSCVLRPTMRAPLAALAGASARGIEEAEPRRGTLLSCFPARPSPASRRRPGSIEPMGDVMSASRTGTRMSAARAVMGDSGQMISSAAEVYDEFLLPALFVTATKSAARAS